MCVCVCVCVCLRERRERGREGKGRWKGEEESGREKRRGGGERKGEETMYECGHACATEHTERSETDCWEPVFSIHHGCQGFNLGQQAPS